MDFIGEKLDNKPLYTFGYLFACSLFTAIIFYALKILNKFPSNWNFFHAAGITLSVVLVGNVLKKLLK